MDARPRPDARGDAELVRAATAGDRGAFAAIYDRYADRLHDFCWSVLRDREEAADASQDAFVAAAERLGQLRDPERLRPWLYAAARTQAFRRARSRARAAPQAEMANPPDPATGPGQAARRSDLRELVWNAAAGLSERDRALLDLHLRHGLEGAELAEAIGVEPSHAEMLLSRLRDQGGRSLAALHGNPLAMLAAVPPMPAPAHLRGRVLERVRLTGGAGPGPPVGEATPRGEAVRAAVHNPGGGRRRGATAALVAALLVAVAVGVGLGWERSPAVSSPTNGQGGPAAAGAATSAAPTTQPTTTAASTSSSSATSATTTATTAPPAPPSLAASPARVDLGPSGTTATLTVRNGGGEPLSWTASPSAPWLRVSPSTGRLEGGRQVGLTWDGPTRSVAVALRVEHPPEIGDLSAFPPQIFTSPCTQTTTLVEATVTDASALSSVTLRWGGRSVPMMRRSGGWSARLGPVPTRGTVPWQVVATDDRGNTASASGPAVRVLACR